MRADLGLRACQRLTTSDVFYGDPPLESAIDIHVPQAEAVAGRWYRQTDAFADGVPLHLTLLYPWRRSPVADTDIVALRQALTGVAPFHVALHSVARFPGVVYLAPNPEHPLRELTRRLALAFPETPPYGGAVADPTPHLTVFTASDEAQLDVVAQELTVVLDRQPPVVARVAEVVVDEERVPQRWTVRARIPLLG